MNHWQQTIKRLLLALCFVLFINSVFGQSPGFVSERKKIRYLKKIERKNERYVKQQEKKTHKLLAKLSKKEKDLYQGLDSTKLDSSLVKNNFSTIEDRFQKELNADPEELLSKASRPISMNAPISTTKILENLSGDIGGYLKQQVTTAAFLSDSACASCTKLRKESVKVKQNISKASAKLERLKVVQGEIKKHQETLKNYGVNTPAFADKLKGINKSCFYYTQGMNGFKELYTNPSKGIESNLIKSLSFNKDFKLFSTQLNTSKLPFSVSAISSLSGNAAPDMSGYQTKAQVQAMLPQNVQGVSEDVKTQLVSNMQKGLETFTEFRDEKPELSMLKDKPNFKVNPYKGLPLIKRLVPTFTFQPEAKTIHTPIIIDIGITLGFKLTQRLTPMIGASSKAGLGQDIHHIAFSYQGIVAKAGFDTKLCYGFSFQGWYEAMWKPYPYYLTHEDRTVHYPQPSLIAGICNTYKITKTVKGTLMIGYDFFYNRHAPYTNPWVIRMGWQ
jgi:hypothetical protein